ncbi:MAG: hypothetical protein AB7P40_25470 [Chloroflexota bacterium]
MAPKTLVHLSSATASTLTGDQWTFVIAKARWPTVDEKAHNSRAQATPLNVGDGVSIRVDLAPHSDVDVQVVTGFITNFSGEEFVLTVFQGIPPAFRGPEELPQKIEGKVLFRGVVSVNRWVEFVDAAGDALAELRRQGLIAPRTTPREEV